MKILIIKPSSLGDIVHSLPVLKILKDSFPDSSIDWVVSKNLKDLLTGNPLIHDLIIFDKDSWKNLKRIHLTIKEMTALVKRLRSKNYDVVLDLQGLLRSGLMTFFSKSSVKVGFHNAREGSTLFYNKKVMVNGAIHAVDRYVELIKCIGANADVIEFPLFADKTDICEIKHLIGELPEYLVIVPGARWQTKRWQPENFGQVISQLSIPCVIAGSKDDMRIAEVVFKYSQGKAINICGKTSLKELINLIANAKAVVSNDSGPMHIAVALDVPVIALFGPTDPHRTGPYRWQEKNNLKLVRHSMECSPCFRKKCKAPLCMSTIGVEEVLEEIKRFL
jgi:heptosyltransferase-1